MTKQQDRNFDALAERFTQKVYKTVKGDWRLQLLKEDLAPLQRGPILTIWDAGCGQGQISEWFAQAGHQVTLCDLSEKMLEQAKQRFEMAELSAEFHHQPAQQLASTLPKVDLVICHAVLEWLAKPLESLEIIADRVKSGGYLSLLFYNRNAMVYGNVLRGGWRLQNIINHSYIGKGKKLTPPNPQYPHEVLAKTDQLGFSVIQHTGIRVFHDYLSKPAQQQSNLDEIFELERQYCRIPTYRDMGRYIHLLLQRK